MIGSVVVAASQAVALCLQLLVYLFLDSRVGSSGVAIFSLVVASGALAASWSQLGFNFVLPKLSRHADEDSESTRLVSSMLAVLPASIVLVTLISASALSGGSLFESLVAIAISGLAACFGVLLLSRAPMVEGPFGTGLIMVINAGVTCALVVCLVYLGPTLLSPVVVACCLLAAQAMAGLAAPRSTRWVAALMVTSALSTNLRHVLETVKKHWVVVAAYSIGVAMSAGLIPLVSRWMTSQDLADFRIASLVPFAGMTVVGTLAVRSIYPAWLKGTAGFANLQRQLQLNIPAVVAVFVLSLSVSAVGHRVLPQRLEGLDGVGVWLSLCVVGSFGVSLANLHALASDRTQRWLLNELLLWAVFLVSAACYIRFGLDGFSEAFGLLFLALSIGALAAARYESARERLVATSQWTGVCVCAVASALLLA